MGDVDFHGSARSLSFEVMDEHSWLAKLARRRAFNLEFLFGGRIYDYVPVKTLRSQPARIRWTVSHELSHSIMSLKGTRWSLTHKGTTTMHQTVIDEKKHDDDICTYADCDATKGNKGCKRFLDADLMWLILSCDAGES